MLPDGEPIVRRRMRALRTGGKTVGRINVARRRTDRQTADEGSSDG